MRTTARTLVQTALGLLLAGCSRPGPVTVDIPIAAPSSAPAADLSDAAIVSVSAMRAPSGLVVDGDLREWGALPPPPSPLPRPRSKDDPEERTGAPEGKRPPPNPPDAASRLTFALTGEGAFIAAEIGEPARGGILVGIGSRVPALPLIGEYFGNLGFVVLDCESKPVVHELEGDEAQGYSYEARSPEEEAECKERKARYAEVKAKHEERFARLFKIDREGVRSIAADGALAPVEGAKAAWKPGPKGAAVEVMLPLKAMPRLSDAPLSMLRLVARAASTPAEITPAQWVWVKLPEPVSFEPYSALRAHAFERALDIPEGNSTVSFMYQQPRGMSYQPGDPLRIEVFGSPYCYSSIAPREEPLYEKLAALGDIEVGRAAAPLDDHCSVSLDRWLAIFQRGRLLRFIKLPGGVKGAVARDGALHVLSFAGSYSAGPGIWSAVAIASDGASREVAVEPISGGKDVNSPQPRWGDAPEFAINDFESFGWRVNQNGQVTEATWRWDAARKVYTGKQRIIPPRKKSDRGRTP